MTPQTDREFVLSRFPKAFCHDFGRSGFYSIYEGDKILSAIFQSPSLAWKHAANFIREMEKKYERL